MGIVERFQGANVIDSGKLSPYWGEHAARYVFAMQYTAEKRVLDIACGTGYGLGLLKTNAKHVTGVDIDPEAAGQALTECDGRTSVLLGDGLELPFANESFDVITSFETLEHLTERARFLVELRRVLSPAGILILSTPNANYTMPVNGKPSNPFHVFEYTPGELTAEIKKQFTLEKLFGQKLNPAFGIPPFYDAEQRLPKDFKTQVKLAGWKVMNKMPISARERLSEIIWKKSFYPCETDYVFDVDAVLGAPVLVVLCRKPD